MRKATLCFVSQYRRWPTPIAIIRSGISAKAATQAAFNSDRSTPLHHWPQRQLNHRKKPYCEVLSSCEEFSRNQGSLSLNAEFSWVDQRDNLGRSA